MDRLTAAETMLALLLIWLSIRAEIAQGQQPTVGLRRPNGTLTDGFTFVKSVRELADGRVLVLDVSEQRLVAADFGKNSLEEVSRAGQGPGEYQDLSALHALTDDTTLVEDRRSLRWILLHGTRPVHTLRTWAGAWVGPILAGADRGGRVLELRGYSFRSTPGVPFQPMPANAESVLVIVHYRARGGQAASVTERADTVVRLRGPTLGERFVARGTHRGTALHYHLGSPLAASDQALLSGDGWIAIVRANPYSVEWRRPDGVRVGGSSLPFERVRVDDRQKRAAIARRWPRVKPAFEPTDFPPWPEYLPPFPNDALLATPDGRLLVLRMPNAALSGTFYDIIDRRGTLVGSLRLKPNERIVGVGPRSLYVVAKDEDDVETLSRHLWP